MTARRCPTCNAERQPDGRAGCDCAAQEVAAAEDFDPLRIRPYVRLSEPDDPLDDPPEAPSEESPGEPPGEPPAGRSHVPPGEAGAGSGRDPVPPGPLPAETDTATEPVHLGNAPVPDAGGGTAGSSRRRRAGAIVAATAAVLLVCAGLLGAALLGQDDTDRAQPDEATATPTTMLPTNGPTNSPSASASPTRPESSSPSAGPSTSPSPSRSAAPPPVPSQPPSPRSSVPEAEENENEAENRQDDAPPVLRRGMSGPEVVELQLRLMLAGGLYSGRPDGEFDSGVHRAVATFQHWRSVRGDPEGVYGPHTRKALEDETDDRYRS